MIKRKMKVKVKKAKAPGAPYVIIRSTNAGCFAGYLKAHDLATQTVRLSNSRRLWQWQGAASLSQLAEDGTSRPNDCKFPTPISGIHTIAEVIEVIPVTQRAMESILSVPIWRA